MTMPSALIIANPAASGFRSRDLRIVAGILVGTFTVEAQWPSNADHARQLAHDAALAGTDLVVAMGGDGIIHHVAQGIIGYDTTLGIVPVGTANVLARQLDIPMRPTAAARLLAGDFGLMPHPLLRVEASGPDGDLVRHALFSLGVGADAEIVELAERDPYRKRGFGPYHYAVSAVTAVRRGLKKREPHLEVSAGTWHATSIGVMAQFCDSYTYFGGRPMRVVPEPPDPITLLLVHELRSRRIASVLRSSIGSRGLDRVNGFEAWRGIESFEVRSPRPFPVQADGEGLGRFARLTAAMAEQTVQVAVPAWKPDEHPADPDG